MSFVPSMREIARRGGRLTTQQLSSVGVATGCSIINRSDVNTNNTIVRSFSRKKSSNSNRNGDTTTTAARSNRALVEKDVDVDSPAEQFRLLLLEFPSLK